MDYPTRYIVLPTLAKLSKLLMNIQETIGSYDSLETCGLLLLGTEQRRIPLMPIRFAPARDRDTLARMVTRGTIRHPHIHVANDNACPPADETLLIETLRHFAAHGLGSADHAKSMAIKATQSGDRIGHQRWLSICGMLDKRMARHLMAGDA